MKKIIIAIDGPAGAGKSTIAKKIASILKIKYIDTGAMYRAITLKLIKLKTNLSETDKIQEILQSTQIDFMNEAIYLDGENVNLQIRSPEINNSVSAVSAIGIVREKLVAIQRQIGQSKSIVMDGRDIGTNVFPDADYKVFLTASIEERAYRRWLEMKEKGFQTSIEDIRQDLIKRDQGDMEREINPLCKSKDAIEIDTTGKDTRRVVEEILLYIKEKNNVII